MQLPVPTTPQLKSIHLLRALLREASYLPDANARNYFRRHVVNRFRAYQPTWNATATRDARAVEKYRHRSVKRRHISIINDRTRAMQRKGQKGLNYLRRANMGELPCLEKILLFTYGRIGRRKYALLEHLLRPDPATAEEAAAPSPLQELYYSNARYLSFFDAPSKQSTTDYVINISDRYSRLKAVVKSQSQKGIALGRDIKRPYLKTPIYNIWQRPMPIKRARNNVKRWYAETMTSVMPPLPNQEWDDIQAMISGNKPISFVEPRTPIVDMDLQSVQEEEQFENLVHNAIALDKPSKADRLARPGRSRARGPRFMQRLYAKILTYCCKLEWDDKHSKWNAVWGGGLYGLDPRVYAAPVDDSLFSGVDTQGRLASATQLESRVQSPRPKKEMGKYTVIPFYTDFLPKNHPVRKKADDFRKQERAVQSGAVKAGGVTT